jgi:homoserine dehydrogenase
MGAASCEASHSDARVVAGQPARSLPKGAEDEARRIDHLPRWSSRHAVPAASLALLGTGTVGGALLQRLARLAPLHDGVRGLRLAQVANSRLRASAPFGAGLDPHITLGALRTSDRAAPSASPPASEVSPADIGATIAALGPRGRRLVIDATGSEAVAARHAEWLAAGLDVVTASKLATGGALARWNAVLAAQARGARYGDSATVGAGLPILRTLRELQAGGDRIRAIAGSLSGSLAWLFARHDGRTPFSQLVAEARTLGYTEPDPRQDLCGEDVRRKLLILARSAGDALEPREVEVESLADRSDAELAARLQPGYVLRYVARWRPGEARIALEALAPDDPLAVGEGCDNRVAFWTDRYRQQPLVLQGPGAGAEVTAAALLDDVLAILRPAR